MSNDPGYDITLVFIQAFFIAVALTLIALGVAAAWAFPAWSPWEVWR